MTKVIRGEGRAQGWRRAESLNVELKRRRFYFRRRCGCFGDREPSRSDLSECHVVSAALLSNRYMLVIDRSQDPPRRQENPIREAILWRRNTKTGKVLYSYSSSVFHEPNGMFLPSALPSPDWPLQDIPCPTRRVTHFMIACTDSSWQHLHTPATDACSGSSKRACRTSLPPSAAIPLL